MSSRSKRTACLAAAALACIAFAATPSQADELASVWAEGPLSRVRLLGGAEKNGQWQAGVEITLKDGAHTYWRSPGDSGVPPVFEFAGSQNLKSASVRYPAPQRMDEAGMQIFGYKGAVIFPLAVTAADAGKPVRLDLHLTYAACEKICMPTEARVTLELDPARAGGAAAARIARFEALTPRPLDAPGAPKIVIVPALSRDPGKPVWRAKVKPAPEGPADLFVEGPDGWIFDTSVKGPGEFAIAVGEKPADATAAPAVTVTLATPDGAFEGAMHLDAGASTP